MPIRTREELLERLIQLGLQEDFIREHSKELVPTPHTKGECALPSYHKHGLDYPTKNGLSHVDMGCGVKHRDLAQIVKMGEQNPLVYYSFLEQSIIGSHPHVKIAILPNTAYTVSTDDIMIHVQPYGPKAEQLQQHLSKVFSNGRKAFSYGECVGFLRATIGVSNNKQYYLYIGIIQTQGNRRTELGLNESGQVVFEYPLPVNLKSIYLDGEKDGINPWNIECFNAIERASKQLGLPVAVSDWEEVVKCASHPALLQRSTSSRRLYEGFGERGYSLTTITLRFPQHYYGVQEREIKVWLKS